MTRSPSRSRLIASGLLIAGILAAAGCSRDPDDSPADKLGASIDLFDAPTTSTPVTIEPWSSDSFVATGMRFLPDGRALVITKGGWGGESTGQVFLLDADGNTVSTLLEVPVCTDAERGLLGVEVGPGTGSDLYLYLFYTRQMNGCPTGPVGSDPTPDLAVFNRVSRFPLRETGMTMNDEEVLVDEIPGHHPAHHAGDLQFLPDGSLLIATGEAGLHRSADRSVLDGKILRIDVEHPLTPLPDNPFALDGDDAGLVYATGFRNPFRIASSADGAVIVAADVGTDEFEEINIITPGEFYGFPDVEGASTSTGVSPIYWYPHDDCANSIIGGDLLEPGVIAELDVPSFVFSDLGCMGIWAIGIDGDSARGPVLLGHAAQSISDIVVGPDGSLYLVPIIEAPIARVTLG